MDMKEPPIVEPVPAAIAQGAVKDRSIGSILVDSGRLSLSDADRIIREQKGRGVRFGDAAIALGLLKQGDIDHALARQFDYAYLQPGDDALSEELVAAFRPFSAQAEQIRALRSQIIVRWPQASWGARALAVTSVERGEGRSFVAANLAVAFAQLGERTLLIDADLRHPKQHRLFRLDGRMGLANVLAERAGIEVVVPIPSLPGLSCLPAGAVPPNPQELLTRPQWQGLLGSAAKLFDVVIVDTSATSVAADGAIAAAKVGAAVLVARRDFARAQPLQSLAEDLSSGGVRIIGSLLNEY